MCHNIQSSILVQVTFMCDQKEKRQIQLWYTIQASHYLLLFLLHYLTQWKQVSPLLRILDVLSKMMAISSVYSLSQHGRSWVDWPQHDDTALYCSLYLTFTMHKRKPEHTFTVYHKKSYTSLKKIYGNPPLLNWV